MAQTSELKYPKFDSGQRLKSEDLNAFVNYFSGSDQNTRVFFIGRGIFYGLSLQYNANANVLSISPGAGLSSDGYLMAFEGKENFNGVAFNTRSIFIGGKIVTAFLLTTDASQPEQFAGLMQDQRSVVLLYFNRAESSKTSSCLQPADQSGSTVTEKVEVLVITENVLETELEKWKGNAQAQTSIKDVASAWLHRFGYFPINTTGRPSISFASFTNWQEIIKNFDSICIEAEPLIGKSYIEIYNNYAIQFGSPLPNNPFSSLAERLGELRKKILANDSIALPYYYDYLKDLVAASTEFLKAVIESSSFLPMTEAFKSYISLGKPITQQGDLYRMTHYKLPIDHTGKDSFNKAKMLFDRLVEIAKVEQQFIIDKVTGAATAVTPSAGIHLPLSCRHISFYLAEKQNLLKIWNYDAIRLRRLDSIPGVDDGKDREALLQDMDAYTFFKIKGHAGKTLEEAKAAIELLREETNLPFDVRVLYIGDASLDFLLQQNPAWFSDLSVLLQNIATEIHCGNFCGNEFETVLFGSSIGDIPAMFEALVFFFKDAPPGNKWEEWAQKICKEICEDRKPGCCIAYLRTLYNLTLEYLRRKNELLDECIFHRFAKKHPGLEHNAGVPKGGTLFLVCRMGEGIGKDNPVLLRMMKQQGKFSDEFRSFINAAFGVPVVMADFCLPYICCSKSPSVNVEFTITFPEADFEESDRSDIRDETGKLLGQKIYLLNKSKSAIANHWTLLDSTGEILEEKDTNDQDGTDFKLLFENGTEFTIRLDVSSGPLSSTKEASFSITAEESILEDRRKKYLSTAAEIKNEDANVTKTTWFPEGISFLSPKKASKKNFDKDFEKLSHNIMSKFDKLTDNVRKKSAMTLLIQSTLFYMDRLVEHHVTGQPAESNENLKEVLTFIRKNSTKNFSLANSWKSADISTPENKELISAYEAMIV